MARNLNTNDAYVLINAVVRQATGQNDIVAIDASSFVSAGELALSSGTENVLNALSLVLNRTIVATRPYKARLDLMEEVNTGLYSDRIRKISYYAKDAVPSGMFNTNLFTNLAEGFTNGQNPDANDVPQSTKSQWEQNQPIPLEINFAGSSTWQYPVTVYEKQLQKAFRSPEEFNRFVAGYMQEHANDIESEREAWNRINLLNKIASIYDMADDMPLSAHNLTAEYNEKFGTSYTSEQLRTTQLESFLKFFVSEFKLHSKYMTERSALYHWSVPKTINGVQHYILRHTPYDRQRVYLYSPLFTEAEAMVLPQIFNPNYLDIDTQYQEVTYWQSEQDRSAVKITPAITDTETGLQVAGEAVNIPYVVGLITDTDGLMTNFQADISYTTPVEARKGYRNIWNTFLKNNIVDNTEKCVLFYMEDGE